MDQADISVHAVDVGKALSAADHRLAQSGALLERYVTVGPSRLFDDETATRVRAFAADLAWQLAGADAPLADIVRDRLAGNRPILLHLHGLAIEARLSTALAARRAIDPLLPPLMLQRLDPTAVGDVAATMAAALLAAQIRAGEAVRRMRLPLAELPENLQQMVHAMAHVAGCDSTITDLPGGGDAQSMRLVLLDRVLADLGEDFGTALRVDHAGLPLFLSAVALASSTPRDVVALALAEDDALRLALLLRAAGLNREEAAVQLLALRPDAEPGLVDLAGDAQRALQLLSDAAG